MSTKRNTSILIVDDDLAVCTSLSLILKKKGYVPCAVNHPSVVLEKIQEVAPSLVLLDMNFTIDTSGRQGIKMLEIIVQAYPSMPVILMTGWATVQLAVRGMKLGAKDFIAKPWDNNQLLSSIESILYLVNNEGKNNFEVQAEESKDFIIGESDAFHEVKRIALGVAQTNANVLITGESGTGKEVIAEFIHQHSKRKRKPFVKINLGGISCSLFESEMFGHKKGAFTDAHSDRIGRFELADTGTIFLDEIGELPLENQVKLLRVLQEKTYEVLGSSMTQKSDVRVISATNKDLESQVYQGLFREDLFYRINLIHIRIPSLRERPADIPLLVNYFSSNICRLYNFELPRIDKEAISWFQQQELPGNIRQLKNMVERAILLNRDKKVLTWKAFQEGPSGKGSLDNWDAISLPKVGSISLAELEVKMIRKTLSFHNHSISAAARDLGITRSALYRRLEKYKIPHES